MIASSMGVFGERSAVIGHRGLGRGVVTGHRQNTLGSFEAAVRAGVRWVEADVRRTGDDTLVVVHDPAYPDGTALADVSGAEVDRRGTLRLRTLFEQLPPEVGVNVDLKSSIGDCLRPPRLTTAGLLCPVVADEAARRPLVVSSFDPAALVRVRHEAPHVALGLLTWDRFPLEMAVAACAHMDVEVLALHVGSLPRDPRTRRLDPHSVERVSALVHRSDRELMVWCPGTGPARRLLAAGTDAVVVDEVPRALRALRAAG